MHRTMIGWLLLFWVAPVSLGSYPAFADMNGDASPLRGVNPGETSDTLGVAREVEVAAYGVRLDSLLTQLKELATLKREDLQGSWEVIRVAGEQLAEMRRSRVADLPEIKKRIDRGGELLAELLAELRVGGPRGIIYEVMRGDHLWGIASKPEIYGDPQMWSRLYLANKDQVVDPNLIYPKQMLSVPRAMGDDPISSSFETVTPTPETSIQPAQPRTATQPTAQLQPTPAEPSIDAVRGGEEVRPVLERLQSEGLWGEITLEAGAMRQVRVEALGADTVSV